MDINKRRIICATALLGVVALVLCIIMAFHSINGAALVGCGAGSACDSVLGGRWSTLLGFIPVSALAASVYVAIIICCLCLLLVKDEDVLRLCPKALLLLAGAVAGSAVWFVGLQIFAEGALCKYCMSAHGIGLAVTALVLVACLKETGRGGIFFAAGVALAAVLAFFQILTAPDYVYQQGRASEPLPLIPAGEAPVVGDADRAEYVIDLLFDYQCSHCQRLHGILPDVVDAFDGRVAFVLCPCPLSPRCNPYVPREDTRFEGSCDLAGLALALWRIDPAAWRVFDSWLFSAEGDDGWWPRPVPEAREMAESLAGADRLDAALSDDFISTRIAGTADLFGRTSSRGQGGIPRFILGDRWVVPEADSAEDIVQILSSEFGIQ